MSERPPLGAGRSAASEAVARVRRQLTGWFLGTFSAILILLGVGLFVAIRHQLAQELDHSLAEATTELARAARIREIEANVSGPVVDAVDELHIPERALYLFDDAGRLIKPARAAAWIHAAALRATREGRVDTEMDVPPDLELELHAERFVLHDSTRMVAVAVADRDELEDRYAALLAAFGAAALVALLLVAGGSWLLVRLSTTPVERSLTQMRRFMADAAHELRTPIAVLHSSAEVALQQPRDAEAYAAALRGIEAESRRMALIVGDLLTLARADAGERPIARERVFLDDVALDAADAARTLATTKRISLTVDEFEEAPIDGDPTLLRQLVMILLDNAIKFTPADGHVRVRVGDAPRPSLVVEDDGVGIAPDQLPHVFERFWRGDPTRARDALASDALATGTRDGAGLGLSIARWIVTEHGADIQVQSSVGGGTSVHVVFPPATIAGERLSSS